jgi:hypothetical protein
VPHVLGTPFFVVALGVTVIPIPFIKLKYSAPSKYDDKSQRLRERAQARRDFGAVMHDEAVAQTDKGRSEFVQGFKTLGREVKELFTPGDFTWKEVGQTFHQMARGTGQVVEGAQMIDSASALDATALKYDVAAGGPQVVEWGQKRRVNLLLTFAEKQDALANFWRNKDRPKLKLEFRRAFARKHKTS